MRRLSERRPQAGLFRGGELPRLLTMIVMLFVLFMMIRKASDTDTWRFLTGEPRHLAESSPEPLVEAQPADNNPQTSQSTPGDESPEPLDQDPEELGAFEEEAQAISDKAPLAIEEMPAYWRLMRWEQSQTTNQFLSRARGDVRIGELIERPDEFRGQLLKVKLYVRQVLKFDNLPANPLGITSDYQAIGWNDDTQAWFYFCVFTELPKGMPTGSHVETEGTFVGYFLKTMAYLDGSGKKVLAPVLIGKMIWQPVPETKMTAKDEWIWPWLIGGVLAALFVVRWGWRFVAGHKRESALIGRLSRRAPPEQEEEPMPIEDWLTQAENTQASVEIKPHADPLHNSGPEHDTPE